MKNQNFDMNEVLTEEEKQLQKFGKFVKSYNLITQSIYDSLKVSLREYERTFDQVNSKEKTYKKACLKVKQGEDSEALQSKKHEYEDLYKQQIEKQKLKYDKLISLINYSNILFAELETIRLKAQQEFLLSYYKVTPESNQIEAILNSLHQVDIEKDLVTICFVNGTGREPEHALEFEPFSFETKELKI